MPGSRLTMFCIERLRVRQQQSIPGGAQQTSGLQTRSAHYSLLSHSQDMIETTCRDHIVQREKHTNISPAQRSTLIECSHQALLGKTYKLCITGSNEL